MLAAFLLSAFFLVSAINLILMEQGRIWQGKFLCCVLCCVFVRSSHRNKAKMIGLLNIGDRVRVIDRVAGHYGQIGVVEKVEASQCSIRMPDGRLILRSTYIERILAPAFGAGFFWGFVAAVCVCILIAYGGKG